MGHCYSIQEQQQNEQEQQKEKAHTEVNSSSSLAQNIVPVVVPKKNQSQEVILQEEKNYRLQGFERSQIERGIQYFQGQDIFVTKELQISLNTKLQVCSSISLEILEYGLMIHNCSNSWIMIESIAFNDIGNSEPFQIIYYNYTSLSMIGPMRSSKLEIDLSRQEKNRILKAAEQKKNGIIRLQIRVFNETKTPGFDRHWYHLLTTGIGSDVVLSIVQVSNPIPLKILPLHSIVLLRSAIFHEIKNSELRITITDDIEVNTILRLISFLYTEELDALVSGPSTVSDWISLLHSSIKWKLETVVSWCIKFLEDMISKDQLNYEKNQEISAIAIYYQIKRLELIAKKKILELDIQRETLKLADLDIQQ